MTEQTTEETTALRPLPATQVKNLISIVTTQYAVLRQQVMDFAAEQTAQKKREIEAAASDAQMRQFEARARTMIDQFSDAFRDLMAEANSQGITLNGRLPDRDNVSTNDYRTKNAITQATAEIEKDRNAALSSLAQAEMQAKIDIHKVGISKAAEEVLATLASPEEAMALAAADRSTRLSLQ